MRLACDWCVRWENNEASLWKQMKGSVLHVLKYQDRDMVVLYGVFSDSGMAFWWTETKSCFLNITTNIPFLEKKWIMLFINRWYS